MLYNSFSWKTLDAFNNSRLSIKGEYYFYLSKNYLDEKYSGIIKSSHIYDAAFMNKTPWKLWHCHVHEDFLIYSLDYTATALTGALSTLTTKQPPISVHITITEITCTQLNMGHALFWVF